MSGLPERREDMETVRFYVEAWAAEQLPDEIAYALDALARLTEHLERVERERGEFRDALIRIESLSGELTGRHTGFVHVNRMARLALRESDRAALIEGDAR